MLSILEWTSSLFPNGGWYIEAGAHNGVGDSQTKVLEDTGKWKGLCIEPSSAFRGLSRSRKCLVDNGCLGYKDDEEVTFREVSGNAIELSGITDHFGDHWDRENRSHKDIPMRTVSLPTMLKKHSLPQVVELLCLDTEGSEHPILSGHDFDQYLFLAIQVEHNGVEEKKTQLHNLLTNQGYNYVGTDGINDRYQYEEEYDGKSH